MWSLLEGATDRACKSERCRSAGHFPRITPHNRPGYSKQVQVNSIMFPNTSSSVTTVMWARGKSFCCLCRGHVYQSTGPFLNPSTHRTFSS